MPKLLNFHFHLTTKIMCVSLTPRADAWWVWLTVTLVYRNMPQGLNYLFEVLLWKFIPLEPYVGWIKMKTYSQIFSAHRTMHFSVTENESIAWNYSFSDSTGIYLFKYSRIKCKICSKLVIKAPGIVLVFFADFEHVNGRWNTLLF